jgi:nicotinamide-nucleotide amidase
MATNPSLRLLAEQTLDAAKCHNLTIITAESCTAGQLATLLSEVPGAADRLHGGFVTYTKENKTKTLGIPDTLLRQYTAVCPAVAHAMAEGALSRSPATLAIAITGVAGPDPDEDGNPVGRVCIGIARTGKQTETLEFDYGDLGRENVQARAMADALQAALLMVAR